MSFDSEHGINVDIQTLININNQILICNDLVNYLKNNLDNAEYVTINCPSFILNNNLVTIKNVSFITYQLKEEILKLQRLSDLVYH